MLDLRVMTCFREKSINVDVRGRLVEVQLWLG